MQFKPVPFSAVAEVAGRPMPIEADAVENGDSEEIEIESMFRQKLAGLRWLPRHERPHAARAARDWRQGALLALRERRARDRHAARTARRLRAPAPS